jgi:hypothetical protein
LFKFKNCSISKNCSYSKIVQTQNLFKLKNCSNSKLFKLKNYSKLKIILIFEFTQIQNCLKNEKPKKPAELVNQGKRKTYRKNTESIELCVNGPRPISLRLWAEPAKARPRAEHRICPRRCPLRHSFRIVHRWIYDRIGSLDLCVHARCSLMDSGRL